MRTPRPVVRAAPAARPAAPRHHDARGRRLRRRAAPAGARPLIVFQTAYDEHALEAFDHASRSELVNLEHVVRIVPAGDGSATLGLADGGRVRVSRRRAAQVRRAVEG